MPRQTKRGSPQVLQVLTFQALEKAVGGTWENVRDLARQVNAGGLGDDVDEEVRLAMAGKRDLAPSMLDHGVEEFWRDELCGDVAWCLGEKVMGDVSGYFTLFCDLEEGYDVGGTFTLRGPDSGEHECTLRDIIGYITTTHPLVSDSLRFPRELNMRLLPDNWRKWPHEKTEKVLWKRHEEIAGEVCRIASVITTCSKANEVYERLKPTYPFLAENTSIQRVLDKCTWPITPGEKERLSVVVEAVRTKDPRSRYEAFWKCVRLDLARFLANCAPIRRAVVERVPLGTQHEEFLERYLDYAALVLVWQRDEEGRGSYRLSVPAAPESRNIDCGAGGWTRNDLDMIVDGLCTAAAFDLVRQLENSFDQRTWVVTCHAPSCGRDFYTVRANQQCCPSREGGRGPSKCKMEWDRFARWLRHKASRDPATDWKDPKLKARFLDYDQEWQARQAGLPRL